MPPRIIHWLYNIITQDTQVKHGKAVCNSVVQLPTTTYHSKHREMKESLPHEFVRYQHYINLHEEYASRLVDS